MITMDLHGTERSVFCTYVVKKRNFETTFEKIMIFYKINSGENTHKTGENTHKTGETTRNRILTTFDMVWKDFFGVLF